jgi:hypothetical protein
MGRVKIAFSGIGVPACKYPTQISGTEAATTANPKPGERTHRRKSPRRCRELNYVSPGGEKKRQGGNKFIKRAHTRERPYAEPDTNPKTGNQTHPRRCHARTIGAIAIYPRHSHGLMNVAPSRGANRITLKRIHLWAAPAVQRMVSPWLCRGVILGLYIFVMSSRQSLATRDLTKRHWRYGRSCAKQQQVRFLTAFEMTWMGYPP